MKRFLFSLIVLIGLAVSNVGYALPDVTNEKADTELKMVIDNQADVLGIYEVVKSQAPEVFTDNAGGTKVTLYGKHKDEAYKFLTEQKNGKNIYTSNDDCFKNETLAVSICRDRQAYKQSNKAVKYIANKAYKVRPSKKWVRYA